ncbi:MAG: hypothetical protein SVW57_11845 [Thermodesulfobacteriota bacterium]|nr:hypothetical protein [Thermodesulfobacteriota bacterium]
MVESMNTFIHLCQPDTSKSCGACCGLYNYIKNDRISLESRLRERTHLFNAMYRGEESIEDYSRLINAKEPKEKIYEVVYDCEFLGFVNEEVQKVGCLLHPSAIGGIDYRSYSFYGEDLCAGHFCPSYQYLAREEKELVISMIDDWYLYGLIITDIDLVKSFFKEISDFLGEMVQPDIVRNSQRLKEIGKAFFNLKVTWPFKDSDKKRFGKYFFEGWEYRLDKIDYEAIGTQPSKHNDIFLSFSSHFSCVNELREAEKWVEKSIIEFCDEYSYVRKYV